MAHLNKLILINIICDLITSCLSDLNKAMPEMKIVRAKSRVNHLVPDIRICQVPQQLESVHSYLPALTNEKAKERQQPCKLTNQPCNGNQFEVLGHQSPMVPVPQEFVACPKDFDLIEDNCYFHSIFGTVSQMFVEKLCNYRNGSKMASFQNESYWELYNEISVRKTKLRAELWTSATNFRTKEGGIRKPGEYVWGNNDSPVNSRFWCDDDLPDTDSNQEMCVMLTFSKNLCLKPIDCYRDLPFICVLFQQN